MSRSRSSASQLDELYLPQRRWAADDMEKAIACELCGPIRAEAAKLSPQGPRMRALGPLMQALGGAGQRTLNCHSWPSASGSCSRGSGASRMSKDAQPICQTWGRGAAERAGLRDAGALEAHLAMARAEAKSTA